jgi:hypothetical protein
MPQPEGWWVQGLMNSPMDFYGPLNLSTTIIETALVVAFKVNKTRIQPIFCVFVCSLKMMQMVGFLAKML